MCPLPDQFMYLYASVDLNGADAENSLNEGN